VQAAAAAAERLSTRNCHGGKLQELLGHA
jgi:hypothetical protein